MAKPMKTYGQYEQAIHDAFNSETNCDHKMQIATQFAIGAIADTLEKIEKRLAETGGILEDGIDRLLRKGL